MTTKFTLFGHHSNADKFRDWCDANFSHVHNVIVYPAYNRQQTHVIGCEITVEGNEEDLLLLQMAA